MKGKRIHIIQLILSLIVMFIITYFNIFSLENFSLLNVILFTALFGGLGALFPLIIWKIIELSKIPPIMKKIRKLKNIILSNKTLKTIPSTKNNDLYEQIGDRWTDLGLELNSLSNNST